MTYERAFFKKSGIFGATLVRSEREVNARMFETLLWLDLCMSFAFLEGHLKSMVMSLLSALVQTFLVSNYQNFHLGNGSVYDLFLTS